MEATELKRRFGKRVQAFREAKGLTQEQLAARIGRSVDTVSNIERGINATRIEVAHQMAVELGVTLPDLFTFAPETKETGKRAAIERLIGLVEGFDDDTIRRLIDLVRAGVALQRPPHLNEASHDR